MSFQACMIFFIQWNTEEDILKNQNQKSQCCCVFFSGNQNLLHSSKYSCLERHESDYMMSEFSFWFEISLQVLITVLESYMIDSNDLFTKWSRLDWFSECFNKLIQNENSWLVNLLEWFSEETSSQESLFCQFYCTIHNVCYFVVIFISSR